MIVFLDDRSLLIEENKASREQIIPGNMPMAAKLRFF
jgi:hypothetical protein